MAQLQVLGNAAMRVGEAQQSLRTLLCNEERDFLIKPNGEKGTLLVNENEESDFLINPNGGKVRVAELLGKTVGLYFAARWCAPSREFTPRLLQAYNVLKQRGEDFEIVYLSSDRGRAPFEEFFGSMPWLALPWRDKTKKDLSGLFRVRRIPTLVVIGPDGKTITTDGTNIVSSHGASAYPFTPERLYHLSHSQGEGDDVLDTDILIL